MTAIILEYLATPLGIFGIVASLEDSYYSGKIALLLVADKYKQFSSVNAFKF